MLYRKGVRFADKCLSAKRTPFFSFKNYMIEIRIAMENVSAIIETEIVSNIRYPKRKEYRDENSNWL